MSNTVTETGGTREGGGGGVGLQEHLEGDNRDKKKNQVSYLCHLHIKCHVLMTPTQEKRNVACFSGVDRLLFLFAGNKKNQKTSKLIGRFGKERLNNIWQAQVPPLSVQPSLPRRVGKPGSAPARLCPLLTGVIHSVSGTR